MNYITKKHINIYIFYGSQLGFVESVALELKRKIIKEVKPFTIYMDILNNLFNYNISKDDFIIILLSTTGDGEFPNNSYKFYKSLRKNKEDLDNITYCLLGFGDSNYRSYCHSSKVLDRILKKKKATKYIETQYNDDAICSNEIIDSWMEEVITYLNQYKNTLWDWFITSMTT